MHPSQRPATQQQRRVRDYVGNADAHAMFNLLTGPQLLDRVEALLPDHRRTAVSADGDLLDVWRAGTLGGRKLPAGR